MIASLHIDDLQVHVTASSSLRTLRGLGSPPPRRVTSARAQRHGVIDQTRFYEGRVVELQADLWGDVMADVWRAFDTLKGKLALGSEHTIRFRRAGLAEDEQLTVRVASEVDQEIDLKSKVIAWGVSLLAADPRVYSAVQRSGVYDPTASLSGGGAAMPLVFPLVFSTTTATHLEVINGGNYPSPPILTAKGPGGDPILDNDTTGESIYLRYQLGAADTIVVDVAARTVKLNGAARPDLFDVSRSTWWELAKGTNRLRMRGSGMQTGKTQLTCQHRDARI